MGQSEFPRSATHARGARARGAAARSAPIDRGRRRPPAEVSFAGSLAIEEAASYLETLVNGLKGGTLTFRQGPDTVALQPGPQVDVKVKVKAAAKGRKGKIRFEVAWTALAPRK